MRLQAAGIEVVVVSSGAIGAAAKATGISPVAARHACLQNAGRCWPEPAAGLYEEYFAIYDIVVGQVLLTRADLDNRSRYLNADTLQALLAERIVPIINENDAVATEEIVGDNDTLSALVSNLVEADLLLILTDQPGCSLPIRAATRAQLISEVAVIDDDFAPLPAAPTAGGRRRHDHQADRGRPLARRAAHRSSSRPAASRTCC